MDIFSPFLCKPNAGPGEKDLLRLAKGNMIT